MRKKYQSAVTLIEVLIAIYIFGIGILVILRMLISNISWLYDLRAKDTAVSLWKEAMDIVFHLRDSNIEKWMQRDCVSVSQPWGSRTCDGSLLTGALNRYRVDRSLTWLYSFEAISDTWDAVLWYHTWELYTQSWQSYTWFRYNHDTSNGQATSFVRRIEIFPQTNYPTMTWRVLGVRSIVEYERWWRENYVILESILWDMR